MKLAIDETERRRSIQQAYNEEHGITPETVRKKISAGIEQDAAKRRKNIADAKEESEVVYITVEYVDNLEREMLAAAEALEFEKAAALLDRVLQLKENIGKPLSEIEIDKPAGKVSGQQRKRRKGIKAGGRTKVPRPKRG